jgi:hypothetical protein
MPVNAKRPDYDQWCKAWTLVRDVVKSDAKKYIKDIDVTDPERCKKYKDDAQFTNFTARTKAGLVGAVFRREPIIKLPSEIEYLLTDATGFRMPLKKLAQECVGEVLMTGRYGILVDYPASEEGLTKAEIELKNLKARIYTYTAESIINWQEKMVDGMPILTLVVLKEEYSELGEDGFEWIKKCQYRVLRLNNGIYTQEVYDGEKLERQMFYTPRDANGNPWEYIPFIFIGSEDNDSDIDPIPLYDLAALNVGHLRNSADYEESVHIVGQPTLVMTSELTMEQFKAANPNGVVIGSRKGLNLGIGGKAEFLQASPNQLADEAMIRKEEQAVMVGARLIVKQLDRETATAAKMRHSGETSILETIANNVEQALELSCAYVARFMSGNIYQDSEEGIEDIDIELNNQYFDKDLDPNFILAAIQLLQNRLVAVSDLRQQLRAYGVINQERTDEEIDKEIDTSLPPVGQDPNADPGNTEPLVS